jgi:hypothetical protein
MPGHAKIAHTAGCWYIRSRIIRFITIKPTSKTAIQGPIPGRKKYAAMGAIKYTQRCKSPINKKGTYRYPKPAKKFFRNP